MSLIHKNVKLLNCNSIIIPLCFAVGWQCASKREQGGFLLWWISLPGVCKGCCDCHPSLGNKMGYRWAPYLMSVGIKCQFTLSSNFIQTEWLIRWVSAMGYLRSPRGICYNVIVFFWWTKHAVIMNDYSTVGVFLMATKTLSSLPQTAQTVENKSGMNLIKYWWSSLLVHWPRIMLPAKWYFVSYFFSLSLV